MHLLYFPSIVHQAIDRLDAWAESDPETWLDEPLIRRTSAAYLNVLRQAQRL